MEQGTSTIIRNMITDFLNVGSFDVPRYVLMGTGFTSLDESPNAQAESRPYISDRSSTSIIRGYEAQFPYNADIIASEEAIMKIYEIGRNQRQAGEAEADYVRCEAFMPTGIHNVHPARKFRVAVEVTDTTGEGTQIIESSGNLNAVGDFIPGCFNIDTKTFYPGVVTRTPDNEELVTVQVGMETVELLKGLFLIDTGVPTP